MRGKLEQHLSDGALLWLLLFVLAILHGARALEGELPLIERTLLWRLQQSPGGSAVLAALTLAMLTALWLILPSGAGPASPWRVCPCARGS